ncbi:hypothetical protein G7B40_000185 [Aetokthonos hydrillicola Thurmond2011]|jgi:uncharacterized membrane protein|uniref:Uncharacterized protein n=1 Tax=Aetokthonos hydrillicola Thurmond2011 TaxID=2712845 RepID=A0AAP5I0L6_9CYAN|nr:hypothetical protein [Aetokthonos hydrillicola]MBO3460147.1 hypothetical protein [Aetokthonos hydrillicola CCALA 1050]MBW4590474.1 hypothetical protein [Aetokthonos hydrillicola CCALA 1050]MDR9893003.1 hypothetical protein [Aetokthonos hydrillicola Thurmond2011]
MIQSQGIRNPSLTLYAFHLRTDISQGPEQTTAEASQLWEQLGSLGQTLHIHELQNLRQKLICYENGQYQPTAEDKLYPKQLTLLQPGSEGIDFQLHNQGQLELKGFLCPFRLHDTYAIDLTLFYEDTIDLVQLHQFNPQGILLPEKLGASLGQTLLLYAEPLESLDDYQVLADTCMAQLFPQMTLPELVATGSLLGNPVFEYDNLEIFPTEQYHILVWFKCKNVDQDNIDAVSQLLLYLFSYRHKILYAYHQSRWCDRQAKQIYSTLERYVNNFEAICKTPDRLQQFKKLLNELPQLALKYARYLRDLQDHETTITINTENYISQLEKLGTPPGNDLAFLQQFLDRANNKFKRQIQADRSYLEPGREFSDQLINTIRGFAAIEQIESDRQFQKELQNREAQFQKALAQQQRQWEQSLANEHQHFQTSLAQQEQERQDKLRQQDEDSQKRGSNLQLAVAFFGVGFAVSGISSQVNSKPLETILGKSQSDQLEPNSTWLSSTIALNIVDIFIHILIGIFFGSIAFILVKIYQVCQNHTSRH